VSYSFQTAIFPLEGVVFFPSLTLPLNIFEPRYILMVNDCIEKGRLLAVGDPDPATGALYGVGTVQLYEKRADGTMVILVRGSTRARVKSLSQDNPYWIGELEPLLEPTLVADEHRFFLQRLTAGLEEWAKETLPDALSRSAFLEGLKNPRVLIETYAHFKIGDADIRQSLLESESLDSRVELLRRVI
jgi:Lon protease-like protein